MTALFDDDFLLESDSARAIYDEIRSLPIFDYHSHLSPREIYEDERYNDIDEMWLQSDHYKWRLMREAGVDERCITGTSGRERFETFASILPDFVGNPVYEWAHMELKRYFGIDITLSGESAGEIWDETSRIIRERHYSPRTLLGVANVHTLMTTDDPLDNLEYHARLRDEEYEVRVLPTMRLDRVLDIASPTFREYIRALESLTHTTISSIEDIVIALSKRLDYYEILGTTLADLSVVDIPAKGTRTDADRALKMALDGEMIERTYRDAYLFWMLHDIARLMSEHDIVLEMHIGAQRNVSTRRYRTLGADTGGDTIANAMNVEHLGVLMDELDTIDRLPRSIYFTHNDSVYYALSAMISSFARDVRGKVQLGAAWWMMDSREGILRQLETFKNTAGIGYFHGMLTDSRSFTSFVRHDYFRRVLASFLARIVDGHGAGMEHAIRIAKDISFFNAETFFGWRAV